MNKYVIASHNMLKRSCLAHRLLALYILAIYSVRHVTGDQKESAFMFFAFAAQPHDVVALRDQPAFLHCAPSLQALGADWSVQWRRNDQQLNIAAAGGRLHVFENGTLRVQVGKAGGSFEQDAGVYQCAVQVKHAQHTWTFVSKKARLTVAVLPRFEEQPRDRQVVVGTSLLLPCRVSDAAPQPTVQWYKDNETLDPAADDRLTLITLTNSLEIRDVQFGDSGVYKCRLSIPDKYRYSNTATIAVVKQSDADDLSEPAFEASPRGQVVKVEEAAVFECLANAQPTPQVVWLKDGRKIDEDDTHSILGSSHLYISSVQSSDTGTYTCRATNTHETVDTNAALEVIVPPVIAKPPKDTSMNETHDVEFMCDTSGRPGPAVTWYKNGETIIPSDYFRIESDRLRVLGLVRGDTGVYQCLAENAAGSVQASAQLVVEMTENGTLYGQPIGSTGSETGSGSGSVVDGDVEAATAALASSSSTQPTPTIKQLLEGALTPDPSSAATAEVTANYDMILSNVPTEPRNLRAATVASRHVELVWDEPLQTQGGVKLYHVFYKRTGSQRERVTNTTSTRVVVQRLEPAAEYDFRVLAISRSGRGITSPALTIATIAEQEVPGAVRNLSLQVLSSTSLKVTWQRPSEEDTYIKFYKLFYTPIHDEHDMNKQGEIEIQVSATSSEYTLHGLDKYTSYGVRMEAHGDNGPGPSTMQVRARTEGDTPSAAPRDLTVDPSGTKAILVTWQPPPQRARNGVVTGYKIRWKMSPRRRGVKTQTHTVDGDHLKYEITQDILPATSYVVKVQAINAFGSGPFTDWLKVTTFAKERQEDQVPGAPQSLRPQADSSSIALTWAPPLDDGIMVRGYIVGWGVGIPDLNTKRLGANQRYFKIENLDASREYVISVRAYNHAGNGFPMYESVRTLSPSAAQPHLHVSHEEDYEYENIDGAPLPTPVYVRAKTLSSVAIQLTWTDRDLSDESFAPQRPLDGRLYNIRYTDHANGARGYQYVNATETAFVIDHLRPNTQYEFTVRIMLGSRTSSWSMHALNKTDIAPPSSAPRDFTISPSPDGNPLAVMLTWQPPRYSNGPIVEYLMYHSTDPSLPIVDWQYDTLRGDVLTYTVGELLPQTTYYFKVQARNDRGFGPISSEKQYRTGGGGTSGSGGGMSQRDGTANAVAPSLENSLNELIDSHNKQSNMFFYIVIGALSTVVLLVVVSLFFWCCLRQRSKRRRDGYVAGKPTEVKPPPDLWIDHKHDHLRHNDDHATPPDSLHDLKQHTVYSAGDDTHPAYHSLAGRTSRASAQQPSFSMDISSVSISQSCHQSKPSSIPSVPLMGIASTGVYTTGGGGNRERRSTTAASTNSSSLVLDARPLLAHGQQQQQQQQHDSGVATMSDADSTLSRSYHHQSSGSSVDLHTGRQRTPQVVYTGPRQHQQPTVSIEQAVAARHHSPYQSTAALGITPTPPPQIPMDGTRTLSKRQVSASGHPLTSFAGVAAPPPPPPAPPTTSSPRTHIVRPVVASSPVRSVSQSQPRPSTTVVKTATVLPNTRGGQTSPMAGSDTNSDNTYASGLAGDKDKAAAANASLHHSYSTEELNAQMQNLDVMIDDLQTLQAEFNVV